METLPSQIASLFARHAALAGFSVRGGAADQLFVGDIGISPAINAAQYAEIFQEVVAALSEVLAEEPEAAESLRGRTFARVLH